jgi:hypothetical protein
MSDMSLPTSTSQESWTDCDGGCWYSTCTSYSTNTVGGRQREAQLKVLTAPHLTVESCQGWCDK